MGSNPFVSFLSIIMLTIEYCRKVLEKYGEKYTDEEIIQIRDQLYELAKYHIADMEIKERREYEKKGSKER